MNSILFHSDNSFRFLKRLMPLLFAFLILLPLSAATLNLAPDVTPGMLNANYWIAKATNPFDVIMPLEDIALFNREMAYCWSDGKTPYQIFYDLRTVGDTVSGSFIREKIWKYIDDDGYYRRSEEGTVSPITDEEWRAWSNMTCYELIEEEQYPARKALCIRHTVVYSFPVDDFISSIPDYWFDNELVQTSLVMNMPLLVLWESEDGQWYFVQSEYYAGWVKKADVVLVDDAEFERYFDYAERKESDFIVITENRYAVQPQYTIPSECTEPVQDLFMGTILNLVDWESDPAFLEYFYPRVPGDCYLVEIPYKKADESLGFRYAAVSAGACSKGFLPYTQANVLTLAFKPLGDRYGWGGMAESEDCSGLIVEVFRCFGFQFARDTSGQSCMPGKILFVDDKDEMEKKLVCRQIPAGSIMYFRGHVFLFIGCENGREYVLSAAEGYYTGPVDDPDYIEANSIFINPLDVDKQYGNSWTDYLERIILLTNPAKYPGVNVRK